MRSTYPDTPGGGREARGEAERQEPLDFKVWALFSRFLTSFDAGASQCLWSHTPELFAEV